MIESSIIDIYELSPMQQGMLFHTLYAPNSGIYFEQRSCLIRGNLNLTAFRQAWQRVVDRHSILRTSFHWQELEKPLQVVHSHVELPWSELVSNSQFPIPNSQFAFDLQNPPLMRCDVIRLTDDSYQFVWSHHHLLMDGWSNGILLKEVFSLYKAFCQGQDLFLPAATPYGNYILWLQQQNQRLAEDYWRLQLQGFTEPTLLFGKKEDKGEGVEQQQIILGSDITNALSDLTKQHNFTLNTIVQGVWSLLLSYYSGKKDIVFGTTVSGRPPELENVETIVGLFINTLPVRVQVDEYAEIIPWLEQLRVQQVETEQYSYSQLVDIQGWSDVERGVSLFESLLVFENYPTSISTILKTVDVDLQIEDTQGFDINNYPLTITAIPGEELLFKIQYKTDKFDAAIIENFLVHLSELLGCIAANPKQKLWQLPTITTRDKESLKSWEQLAEENNNNNSIPELFAAQVEKNRDAVAVIFGSEQLTYGELNEKINQLANYLRGLGVREEVKVGIYVERSLEMVVGLLGILKAGGAYVPLDPVYSQERLEFILFDSQVSVLLTQSHLHNSLSDIGLAELELPVVCLDIDWELIIEEGRESLDVQTKSEDLAYVIYTSGSTGQPKGVMVEHGSLVNYILVASEEFEISSEDRVLQFASISFDAAAEEIFPCLISGATLVLRNEEMLGSIPRFLKFCDDWKITVLDLPTAFWHLLVDELCSEPRRYEGHEGGRGREEGGLVLPQELRLVIVGGEKVLLGRLVAWNEKVGTRVRLLNSYGPTEATIVTTFCDLSDYVVGGCLRREVSIGKAVGNIKTYILDKQLNLVPVGVPGELYIGGIGVARGYLGKPDLTAAVFVPDLFSEIPGTRLYKTGDRVCYFPDGSIEYLGRLDNQVKIRGFRIELGEIEAVLNQHPDVRESIVTVFEDDGDKRLVAYIASSSSSIDLTEVKQFLAKKVPSYMIASHFITLDALPITPNGKIDRRALPKPELQAIQTVQTVINSRDLPRTPTEELLVGIWQSVLNLKFVGVNDNFFALGGHSLLVTRIISQIQLVFGVDIPLRQIFETPTIVDLAKAIEQSAIPNYQLPIQLPITNYQFPIQKDYENLPLSFAQQRLWLLAQLEPNNPAYNVSAALRLSGELNVGVLKECFVEIIRRHEVLRTSFTTIDGRGVAVVTDDVDLQIPVIDLSSSSISTIKQQEIVEEFVSGTSQEPFNLENLPLLRVTLLHLNSSENILLLTMHHIVTDAWSVDILAQEIAFLYEDFSQGKSSYLKNLTIQYTDFAIWQRKCFENNQFNHQLEYWREHLQSIPELLELPTDFPRPAIQSGKGKRYSFELSVELTQQIKNLIAEQHITLFMVMFSALSVLLHRYSQQDEIVIGSPIANRHYQGTDSLIGFFVNTLALRVSFADNPSVEELLLRVREIILAAHTHQDIPFEQVVEALQPTRSLSYSPLFQVMLVVENAPTNLIEFAGLHWSPLEIDSGTAKFDLTLMMRETEGKLLGKWEYNCDLFTESTIIRFTQHLQVVLTEITSKSTEKIGELSLISETERQQIISLGNPKNNYIYSQCIHELFEQQVEKSGNAIAVVCEKSEDSINTQLIENSQSQLKNSLTQNELIQNDLTENDLTENYLTYAELNSKANQLAHYLKSLGVKKEVAVGIYLEKSLDFIIGILGILKAGGFYVPLDVGYPKERLEFLIEDAGVEVLLTQKRHRENLTSQPSSLGGNVEELKNIFCFDSDWENITHYPTTNLVNETRLENLAYVMYTSGSTGVPKGVCIPHRGIVRLVKNCDYAHLDGDEVILQAAPIAFDASTFEIWGGLLNGSRLVILSNQQPTLAELALFIIQNKITTLWLTAGLFHLMVDEHLNCFKDVKQLLAGGDVLSVIHIKKLLEVYPQCRVINGYGPTENTAFTCCYPISDVEQLNNTVPIGRPINNTQVYILDKYLHPLPVGVPGELYIAGDGLARGYLNQPELTNSQFPTPHSPLLTPHPSLPTPPLYKTGDRVRYLADGNIEYLGRLDNQVKIRGFRIELGEIEAVLSQHPDVLDCVVIAHSTSSQHKQLVAYFVTSSGLSGLELRQFLQQRLPDYLIPNFFIPLKNLPLTTNGKVDRRALPKPELTISQNTTLPRTEIEERLVNIWSNLLNVSPVGINDNFFALGGDSILAIQVISRANQVGLQLTPKQLFQHQTIAELATVVTPVSISIAEQGIVTGTLPLTPIQHWFFEQELLNLHHFNQAVLLRVSEKLQPGLLTQALNKILQHHDILRSRYTKLSTSQSISESISIWKAEIVEPDDNVPVICCDLSNLSETQQLAEISKISAQIQSSLNITDASLLKIVNFDLGVESRLLIVIHHLVIDGVSWRILLEDLQSAYQQLLTAEALTEGVVKLPPKTTSFPAWVEKIKNYATSTTIENKLNYWLSNSYQKIQSIPIDNPNGSNKIADTNTINVSLSKEETQALLKEVPSVYNTQINDVLLTACTKVISTWINNELVLIDLETYGRNLPGEYEDVDVSRTVGWFTAIYPLILKYNNGDNEENEENKEDKIYRNNNIEENWGNLLKDIKEQLRRVPDSGLSYGLLRYLSNNEENRQSLQKLPSAQICFNYLGQLDTNPTHKDSHSLTFTLCSDVSGGLSQNLEQTRCYQIEINGFVKEECLQFEWIYSEKQYQKSTIAQLTDNFYRVLQQIIAYCRLPDVGGYTPSDFELADVNQETLDLLLGMVNFETEDKS